MENFTPIPSLLGGILIGLSAAALYFLTGKILGVSNITAELLNPRWEGKAWRATFLAGVLSGGGLLLLLHPQSLSVASPRSLGLLIFAGFLVGYGASLGRGCTSGHGICGMSRLSARSIVATLVFMGSGMATVYISRHLAGLP